MAHINDADPKIENVQIALWRKAPVAQRAMRMQSLSQMMANLSRRAIMRNHPEFNQRQADLFFVRLHYGDRLAENLKAYLDRQS